MFQRLPCGATGTSTRTGWPKSSRAVASRWPCRAPLLRAKVGSGVTACACPLRFWEELACRDISSLFGLHFSCVCVCVCVCVLCVCVCCGSLARCTYVCLCGTKRTLARIVQACSLSRMGWSTSRARRPPRSARAAEQCVLCVVLTVGRAGGPATWTARFRFTLLRGCAGSAPSAHARAACLCCENKQRCAGALRGVLLCDFVFDTVHQCTI